MPFCSPRFLPTSLPSPFPRAFNPFPRFLSNKGWGREGSWLVPLNASCLSLAFKALICLHSWPGGCVKGRAVEGGPAFSIAHWDMWEASTKSFQTKGINIICGAISLPGAQYGSGSATRSPQVLCAVMVDPPQTHSGPGAPARWKVSFLLPLCADRSPQTQSIQVEQWVGSNWWWECP